MMEVWSVYPELVVPRVERRVDKSAILKAIEDRQVTQGPPSLSPQLSSRIPPVPQTDLSSNGAVHEGHASSTSKAPVYPSVENSDADDVSPSA